MSEVSIGNTRLIHGNVLEVLKAMPSESVDLIVTSPPYYSLRQYPSEANIIWGGDPNCEHEWETIVKPKPGGIPKKKSGIGNWDRQREKEEFADAILKGGPLKSAFCKKCGAWYGQLGLEPTPELYVEHLGLILKELYRVLKPTGVFFLNIGDSYSGDMGKRKGWSYVSGLGNKKDGTAINTEARYDVPRKGLLAIPERVLFKAMEIGFIRRNTIIWRKPNALPSSAKDRFTNTFEYIYFFVKKPKGYYFNLDAVREPYDEATIERAMRFIKNQEHFDPSRHKHGDFMGQNPYEVFENFVKSLIKFNIRVRDAKEGRLQAKWGDIYKASEKEIEEYVEGTITELKQMCGVLGKNPGDVWDITTEGFKEAHFSVFPKKLVARCIACACPPDGGVVLDPFSGSGTTAVVCELFNTKQFDKISRIETVVNLDVVKNMNWNIRCIGIDIVKDYIDMAYNRIKNEVYHGTKSLEVFAWKEA